MSQLYEIKLDQLTVDSDNFSFESDIGDSFSITVSAQWDTVLQYQYDLIEDGLKTKAYSLPLIKKGEMIRDYDYLEYYLQFASEDFNWIEWWATTDTKPFDVRSMGLAQARYLIKERAGFCKELRPIVTKYEEGLRWNITVEDTYGGTSTAVIQPGGWFKNQDFNYSYRFVSEKARIGHDDIPYVRMIVEDKNA